MKCERCKRTIPSINHITKGGCLWCDDKHDRKKICQDLDKYGRKNLK